MLYNFWSILLNNTVWACFTMVEMSERSIVVWISTVVSPIWFVSFLWIKLNILLNNWVWGSLSVIEMGEWTIVVRVATIVSPFWFIFSSSLDILLDHWVWASFTVIEMGEWSIVVGISTILSPFWFILLSLFVLMFVMVSMLHCGCASQKNGNGKCFHN